MSKLERKICAIYVHEVIKRNCLPRHLGLLSYSVRDYLIRRYPYLSVVSHRCVKKALNRLVKRGIFFKDVRQFYDSETGEPFKIIDYCWTYIGAKQFGFE